MQTVSAATSVLAQDHGALRAVACRCGDRVAVCLRDVIMTLEHERHAVVVDVERLRCEHNTSVVPLALGLVNRHLHRSRIPLLETEVERPHAVPHLALV